ncbi:MAG: ATP synthase subunit I [Candidatus Omnitrophota bacterium]|nr:ATP synthase subunit I [Candidatus Omnitrophota bacterium]
MKQARAFENRLTVEILGIVFLVGTLFFLLGKSKISLGVVIGGMGSSINFKLMVKSAKKKIEFSGKKNYLFFPAGYFLRYATMTAILLGLSFKGLECLIGGAIGLFCLRLSIFVDTIFYKNRSLQN